MQNMLCPWPKQAGGRPVWHKVDTCPGGPGVFFLAFSVRLPSFQQAVSDLERDVNSGRPGIGGFLMQDCQSPLPSVGSFQDDSVKIVNSE